MGHSLSCFHWVNSSKKPPQSKTFMKLYQIKKVCLMQISLLRALKMFNGNLINTWNMRSQISVLLGVLCLPQVWYWRSVGVRCSSAGILSQLLEVPVHQKHEWVCSALQKTKWIWEAVLCQRLCTWLWVLWGLPQSPGLLRACDAAEGPWVINSPS